MTTTASTPRVTTTCGYCGVGCRLEAHARDGRIASICPALDGPANEGHTCLKGRFAHQFSRSRDRLTTPLIREGGGFRARRRWDEAIERIVAELTRIKAEHGPDAIAGLASSRATNEDCYAMQRLMRAAIGTNNIDNCSRVCHSPTSFALRKSLGLSGATGSFADIDHADAAILIGANPTEGHPVVGARIKQAALRGLQARHDRPAPDRAGRLRRPAPRAAARAPTPPSCSASRTSSHRDGLVDRDVHRRAHRGLRGARGAARRLHAGRRSRRSPASRPPTSRRAAHIYGEAERRLASSWGLGVTEHKYGSEVVQLICNLALMTGKVGRPGSALLPLRGQNNVQGSSDMGALPDTYTGYRSVDDEDVAQLFEEALGRADVARARAARSREMFDAAVAGDLKAMYIFGEDVAQTDPNTAHVVARARVARVPRLPGHLRDRDDEVRRRDPARLVVPREGRARSPTPSGASSSSTPAIDPPGERARPTSRSSRRSRARSATRWAARRPRTRWTRSRALTPRLRRRHATSGSAARGLQWPVAPDGTDSPILYDGALRAARRPRAASPRCPTRRPATRPTRSSR